MTPAFGLFYPCFSLVIDFSRVWFVNTSASRGHNPLETEHSVAKPHSHRHMQSRISVAPSPPCAVLIDLGASPMLAGGWLAGRGERGSGLTQNNPPPPSPKPPHNPTHPPPHKQNTTNKNHQPPPPPPPCCSNTPTPQPFPPPQPPKHPPPTNPPPPPFSTFFHILESGLLLVRPPDPLSASLVTRPPPIDQSPFSFFPPPLLPLFVDSYPHNKFHGDCHNQGCAAAHS